jgi:hypothetical protein
MFVGCNSNTDIIQKDDVFDRYAWWDSRDRDWYSDRIPFIETPDAQIDEVYYYRWEVVKTHLTYGSPETGYLFTEFMDRPFWSGTYGGISCPLGHQLTEIRWLNDARVVDDFARYWMDTEGSKPRTYSNWYASALWQIHEVKGDSAWAVSMLPYMEEQFHGWLEDVYDAEHGMFYKSGHDDGMEININSRQLTDNWVVEGYRPTLNAYLYGDLLAMSKAALLAGNSTRSKEYASRADSLKKRVLDELWDEKRQFFFHQFKDDHNPGIKAKSLTYETGPFAGNDNGRELIGYVPWQFNLPDAEQSAAWKFLMDPAHFYAPYGPTVTSQSDPQFRISPNCCVWSGQSWPYATTQTLVAMANLLNNYDQDEVDAADYFDLLKGYTRTQYKDGRPYIAESANPLDGSWFGSDMPNHSEHYFHSGYVDLVLGGLLGIRAQPGDSLIINPLIPADWDYFAVEDLAYHGRMISLIWDRDGERYGRGAGLSLLIDGRVTVSRPDLGEMTVHFPSKPGAMAHERPHNLAVNNGRSFPEISASYSDPAFPPFAANDGAIYYHKFPTNRWATSGSPNTEDWISLDLGAEQTIESVKLYFLDDGEGIVPPASYRVELFRKGGWEEAAVQSRRPARATGRVANVIFLGAVKASGVRVFFEHAEGGRTGLTEIEVWTPPGGDVHPAEATPRNLAINPDRARYPSLSASFPDDADASVLVDGSYGLTTYQANRWIAYGTPNETDWVQLDFGAPTTVSQVDVYLWGNAPRYLARVDSTVLSPRSLRVEYQSGPEWTPVSGARHFPERPLAMARNTLSFEAVETTAIRILFEHDLPAVSGATEIQVWREAAGGQ